ncbi:MAG: hypothetical protein KKF89_05115 [Nanoarchaeota archaeon]|nr:hypothetical protein [Nanoarchaeota archaeon]MBU1855074.1 hypothetical protein [Nanoarchaeota archaeon]
MSFPWDNKTDFTGETIRDFTKLQNSNVGIVKSKELESVVSEKDDVEYTAEVKTSDKDYSWKKEYSPMSLQRAKRTEENSMMEVKIIELIEETEDITGVIQDLEGTKAIFYISDENINCELTKAYRNMKIIKENNNSMTVYGNFEDEKIFLIDYAKMIINEKEEYIT